jgi:hypothetical protein
MLFYHETQNEQIHLDKEPLLNEYKCARKTKSSPTKSQEDSDSDYQIINDISVYIDEYYLSKLDVMSVDNSENIKDLNNNVTLQSPLITYSHETEIGQNLLGIFVISFDTKLGNVIEWQIPDRGKLNLDGVEFKAMASGLHLVQNDFVYFCKNDMYGLAAFESIRIDDSEQRNVRMKSVGLVAKSYTFLKKYVVFLKNQVRNQLEEPGNYDILVSLWNKKKVLSIAEFDERSYEFPRQEEHDHSLIDKIFNKRLVIYKVKLTFFLMEFRRKKS